MCLSPNHGADPEKVPRNEAGGQCHGLALMPTRAMGTGAPQEEGAEVLLLLGKGRALTLLPPGEGTCLCSRWAVSARADLLQRAPVEAAEEVHLEHLPKLWPGEEEPGGADTGGEQIPRRGVQGGAG